MLKLKIFIVENIIFAHFYDQPSEKQNVFYQKILKQKKPNNWKQKTSSSKFTKYVWGTSLI